MKLALNMGYWAGRPPADALATILEAERLGYDSVWCAEAYGSDALTPLAWWGAHTTRLRLGTGIMQIPARTPAAAAMAAMSLDHLSGGRFIAGFGASGPQVVEGWHGQPFAKPLGRSREYVEVVRAIVAREQPVEFAGEHYRLPIEGGTGLGKPLRSSIHPYRADLPIVLAAEGPRNIALAAELCDGWIAIFYSPRHDAFYREALDAGFARPGARRSAADFEVFASVPMVIADDPREAADRLRANYALYFGGMGARDRNFHADVARRMGYEQEIDAIQDAYLAGHKDEAAALLPFELIDDLALIGSPERIRDRLAAWEESIVDVLLIQADLPTVRAAADIVLS